MSSRPWDARLFATQLASSRPLIATLVFAASEEAGEAENPEGETIDNVGFACVWSRLGDESVSSVVLLELFCHTLSEAEDPEEDAEDSEQATKAAGRNTEFQHLYLCLDILNQTKLN